ncbi:MAG: transposase, partial [Longimicrobiales bacterium]
MLSLPKRIRPFRLTTLASPAPCFASCCAPSAPRSNAPVRTHFHFHIVVLDGVFAEGDGGAVTFHEATHLSIEHVHRLQPTLQRRVLHLFQRRGLLDDHIADTLTWQASGGFSLDASVRIHGSDSAGRERLLRYCARPPFALERLRIERRADGS